MTPSTAPATSSTVMPVVNATPCGQSKNAVPLAAKGTRTAAVPAAAVLSYTCASATAPAVSASSRASTEATPVSRVLSPEKNPALLAPDEPSTTEPATSPSAAATSK